MVTTGLPTGPGGGGGGRNHHGPPHDAILVTKLPSNLLTGDLKPALLEHFAQFGVILRFSCSRIKNVQTAHFQYSSVDEARNALANGSNMRGNCLAIKTTDKHPNTKLIPFPPRPSVPISLPMRTHSVTSPSVPFPQSPASTSSSSAGPSTSTPNRIQGQQQTLDSFFCKGQDAKERKPGSLEPKPNISVISCDDNALPPSSSTTTAAAPIVCEPVASTSTAGPLPKEEKPKVNSSVKIEIYSPPSSTLSRASSISLPSLSLSNAGNNIGGGFSSQATMVPQAHLRPTRSLRDIFYFDIPGMKTIRNNTEASDALACQYFTGGAGAHPFPLAMMFGRAPGSVIMPLNSIMNAITTDLEIRPATLELIWTSVENSVLKTMVRGSAEKNMRLEKDFGPFLSDWAEDFIGDLVDQNMMNDAVEEEISLEEDRMIACEDVLEELIGQVCNSMVEESTASELQLAQTLGEVATTSYEDMETSVVTAEVEESALALFVHELCTDVVDELLDEGFYIDGVILTALAADTLRRCKVEREESALVEVADKLVEQVVKDSVENSAAEEYLNELFSEVIEDLLESTYFSLCVKVVARNAIEEYKEDMEDDDGESDSYSDDDDDDDDDDDKPDKLLSSPEDLPSSKQSRVSEWIKSLSLPNSQSSIDSNYVSPPPSSVSDNDSEIESNASYEETDSSASSSLPLKISSVYSLQSSSQEETTTEVLSSSSPTTPIVGSATDTQESFLTQATATSTSSRLSWFGSLKRKATSMYQELKRRRLNQ